MTAARPALFLDRDGVINVDHGYVHRQEDFEFIDGIQSLIHAANVRGYAAVIVSNQAGIGRGLYTEQEFWHLTDWMCRQLAIDGAHIDKVYFSPTHPTAGIGDFRRDDLSRKPNPGMVLQAITDLNLDVVNSVMVGDKLSDIRAGIAAGVGCNILYGAAGAEAFEGVPCHRVQRLADVLAYLTWSGAARQ